MPDYISSGVLGTSIQTGEIDDGAVTYAKLATDAERQLVPVGTILMWAKSITGVPALPDGWLECDGSTVSDADSPINGQAVPDLQTGNPFIRGSTTSGSTGGSASHTHTLSTSSGNSIIDASSGDTHVLSGTAGSLKGTTNAQTNTPSYYEVVFIIKIK